MSDNFWSTYFAVKAAHRSMEYEKYLRDNNLTRKEDRQLRRKVKTKRTIAKLENFADKLNATTDRINDSNNRLKREWFGKK